MAKGDKYSNLRVYLENSNRASITLSFDEIEHIIGASLPPSASKYPNPWWANHKGNPRATAWFGAGYRTVEPVQTCAHKTIVFIKA